MDPAPFHAVPDGEPVGDAYWVKAQDGVRLRLAAWHKGAKKGTVLLFPGRTEYVEKYALTAGELAQADYATLAIDWRGQGLADRLQPNKNAGHVDAFSDYQIDVAALLETAESLALPKPYFLLGHSMGGFIGLRAMVDGLPVKAAAFTGPMWDIGLERLMRPLALLLATLLRALGFSNALAPSTKNEAYVLDVAFEDNKLTKDRQMYARLQAQARATPELMIGGPSIRWVHEALRACTALAREPAPTQPSVTFLGTDEKIVCVDAIHSRVAAWPNAELEMIEAGEHEVLMEGAEVRTPIMAKITALFDQNL